MSMMMDATDTTLLPHGASTPSAAPSRQHPAIAAAWRRACVACTKAKRQCTKQVPRCRRCLDKRIPCTYPPARRPETSAIAAAEGPPPPLPSLSYPDDGFASFPLVGGGGGGGENLDDLIIIASAGSTSTNLHHPHGIIPEEYPTFVDFLDLPDASSGPLFPMEEEEEEVAPAPLRMESPQPPPPAISSNAMISNSNLNSGNSNSIPRAEIWFLCPSTWTAEFSNPPTPTASEIDRMLNGYISRVKQWTQQWVTTGHSPLHHRELYSLHMPRHVQDAYTAAATYFSTSQNPNTEATAIVHRILEDRVTQLLRDQEFLSRTGDVNGNGNKAEPSIFDHLSRVQSLLIYQVIRLFDGDIRMRAQAEALIPTLFLWNRQLLESAKDSLGQPERFLSLSSSSSSPYHKTPPAEGSGGGGIGGWSAKTTWRAWIVAESVRRTWQVSGVVQDVYLFFKRGWAECPGRLPTTMRGALWDAESAHAWAAELVGDEKGKGEEGRRDPFLTPLAGFDHVFERLPAVDVDDFNLTTIGLYGMEKAERWLEEGRLGRRTLTFDV